MLSSYLEWHRFSSRTRSEHQLHQLPIMWMWATRLVFQSLRYGDFVRIKWFPCMKMLSTHSRCSMTVFFWSLFKRILSKMLLGFAVLRAFQCLPVPYGLGLSAVVSPLSLPPPLFPFFLLHSSLLGHFILPSSLSFYFQSELYSFFPSASPFIS